MEKRQKSSILTFFDVFQFGRTENAPPVNGVECQLIMFTSNNKDLGPQLASLQTPWEDRPTLATRALKFMKELMEKRARGAVG